jgi:restriction system protein
VNQATAMAQQQHREIDALEAEYRSADPDAVIPYSSMVLEASHCPEGFPQRFKLAYVPESRQLGLPGHRSHHP